MSAMDQARFTALWASVNMALNRRGLADASYSEALDLWQVATREEERAVFRSLKARHCTGTCPQEAR